MAIQAVTTNTALDVNAKEHEARIGVGREERLELAKELGLVLSNTYALYAETQGVHWNIVGPLFYSVHKLTEEQYKDLGESIDDIAERIRALGFRAPAGLKSLSELSFVNSDINYKNGGEMIKALIRDNETLVRKMRKVVELAENSKDVKTADLLTDRIGVLEQQAWMLRAIAS